METNGARGCYIWGAAAGAQLAPCHKESPSPAILAVLLCILFILVGTPTVYNSVPFPGRPTLPGLELGNSASLAQLVEHALRKRMVVGSIPTGGSLVWQHHEPSQVEEGQRLSQTWAPLRTSKPLATPRLLGKWP